MTIFRTHLCGENQFLVLSVEIALRMTVTSGQLTMSLVLVIEDHTKLRESIVRTLNESGMDAIAAESIRQANQQLTSAVNLIVLDLMLPDGDGLDWLADLRIAGNRTPVLILTARDSIKDRVLGLDQGADDYLVKPFAIDELLARIRALFRRDAQSASTKLTVDDLTVDLLTRSAERAGETLELQNRQFELLVYLMRYAHQVVTREMISWDIWKEPKTTWTNVIDVHVNQLRKQLDRTGKPPVLHTIRGKGYVLGTLP